MPSVGDRAQMFLSQFRPQPPSPSGPEMYQKYMSDQSNDGFVRNQLSSGPLSVGEYEYGASFPRPASFTGQYPNLSGAQAEERQRDMQKPQYPGTVIPTPQPTVHVPNFNSFW